jgi:DNA adenine methylase
MFTRIKNQNRGILDNYPGSKLASGLPQFIINHIPCFDVFIEGCAGTAAISMILYDQSRFSKLSSLNQNPTPTFLLYDLNEDVIDELKIITNNYIGFNLYALSYFFALRHVAAMSDYYRPFVYLDPPYMKSTRRTPGNIYECDWNDSDHEIFLQDVLNHSKYSNIMISGYANPLYAAALSEWYMRSTQVMTRGGIATETIWMNYNPDTIKLATYAFLGTDFTDRQRIKKKINSLKTKLHSLPFHEKNAILSSLISLKH